MIVMDPSFLSISNILEGVWKKGMWAEQKCEKMNGVQLLHDSLCKNVATSD